MFALTQLVCYTVLMNEKLQTQLDELAAHLVTDRRYGQVALSHVEAPQPISGFTTELDRTPLPETESMYPELPQTRIVFGRFPEV